MVKVINNTNKKKKRIYKRMRSLYLQQYCIIKFWGWFS